MGDHTFGSVIRKRRDVLGLSQSRLAELVGRSTSTVRNWERDRATPSEATDVVALAAILGVDEATLLEQAGFEPTEVETSPTLQQSLASLITEVGESLSTLATESGLPGLAAESSDAAAVTEPPPVSEPAGAGEEADIGSDDPSAMLDDTGRDADQAAGGGEPTEEPPAPTSEPALAPPPRPVDPVPAPDTEPTPLPPVPSIGDPIDAGAPPSEDWSSSEPPSRAERRRRTGRAAPPTVLESAPPGEPSYLEDPEERQRYRVRAVATAAIVVVLAILFLWAFDRTTDAAGDMWQQFTDMLSI